MKLHQLLALERDAKDRAKEATDNAKAALTKEGLFSGMTRRYQPIADDGEWLPDENQRVQLSADQVFANMLSTVGRLWDLTAEKELANQGAMGEIIVDGLPMLRLPGTYLVWLEKQLVALRDVLGSAPVLDPALSWTYDDSTEMWRSEPVETVRSQKVTRVLTLAPADANHPAQVTTVHVDEPAGKWTMVRFSGAFPESQVRSLVGRIDKLIDATRVAREQANQQDTLPASVAGTIVEYLFG